MRSVRAACAPAIIGLLTALVLLASTPSRACTACACGSSAALPVGAEVPWAGRLRAGVVVSTAGTTNVDDLGRADALAATVSGVVLWAPSRGLMLDVAVPLGARLQLHDGQREGTGFGLGDIDVGARLLLQDKTFAPTWLGGLRLGLRAPTTTWLRRADGSSRPRALQPGLGEVGLTAQLQGVYAPTRVVTVVGLVDALVPVLGLYDQQLSGAIVEAKGFGLLRANDLISVRAGLGARAVGDAGENPLSVGQDDVVTKAPTTSALEEARATVFVEAGVVVDLTLDTQLAVVTAVPVAALGTVRETPRVSASLLFDW